ncbi:MAG: nuclear transport factor 2 family protein [Planctomycetes bacterium]|nr:nuclear transport factor 2 family protein [Planctomycetota bacterium]
MQQLTPQDAQRFATRWFSAWNAQNLDAIMACYDETIEHSSPFVARFNAGVTGEANGIHDGTLRGKSAVRAYFGRALTSNPTPSGIERFELMHLTTGINSVLVVYRRWTGELAGEIFFLNDAGLIVRSVSHYG